mmetsp:Transcript_40948/g.73620  ORF Transcript_40948/g.73620 Transcript_40948/m.73620 type:complete len:415 (-) Transcript_40948:148-1392(-)
MRTSAIVAFCFWALADAGRFGPQGCISVTRSSKGTCMLATNCDEQDISNVEFAFDCEQDEVADEEGTEITRHSYGLGGFDANEDFDTQVKCARCSPPSSSTQSDSEAEEEEEQPPARAAPVQTLRLRSNRAAAQASRSRQLRAKRAQVPASKKAAGSVSFRARRAKSAEGVKYGPDGCVKTYKSAKGHCIMETSCEKSNMTDYTYGLVCVDKVGAPTRHLFGKGSFLPEETFNTLIACNQCLGLEEIPSDVGLTGEVLALSKDIKHLDQMMKNMSINIQMLNTRVFDGQPPVEATTVEEVATEAAAPAPAAATALLIHRKASKRLHHHQVHHHHRAQSGAHHQMKARTMKLAEGEEDAMEERHTLPTRHHRQHRNREHERKRARHPHKRHWDDDEAIPEASTVDDAGEQVEGDN